MVVHLSGRMRFHEAIRRTEHETSAVQGTCSGGFSVQMNEKRACVKTIIAEVGVLFWRGFLGDSRQTPNDGP